MTSRATYISYGIGVIVLIGLVTIVLLLWIDRDGSSETAIEETVATSVDTMATEPPGTSLATPSQNENNNEMIVTTLADTGEGSLRQALLDGNSSNLRTRISFDRMLFADPQTIILETPLPTIRGHVIIDGYIPDQLWKATGVIVSGGSKVRVFEIAEDSYVEIRSLSIINGSAQEGAAIYNRGDLVVSGVTLQSNMADERGGALANYGQATIVNSTFLQNSARWGGAIANLEGRLNVTHATFSENHGGALASTGELLLRNNIIANSTDGVDCLAEVDIDPLSTNNLIESNHGCGVPIISEDPLLDPFGYYNGPTKTISLGTGSPAINLGDNASSLDENGEPLVWDQRGNGDPRYVMGFSDLGAFEQQANPFLEVDTIEDTIRRGCGKSAQGDCPLRAALEIANAMPNFFRITFDPRVFVDAQTLKPDTPLPTVTADIVLDANSTPGVTIVGLTVADGVDLQLEGVMVE